MNTTTQTLRPSALIALELEDLRNRRTELQADLDAAGEKYAGARRGVISRIAKTKEATDAKSALDAISSICEEVDGTIADLNNELETAEAAELRAAKIIELRALNEGFKEHYANMDADALKVVKEFQAFLERSWDGAGESHKRFCAVRNLESTLDLSESEKTALGLSRTDAAWGAGLMFRMLTETGEIDITALGALRPCFVQYNDTRSTLVHLAPLAE